MDNKELIKLLSQFDACAPALMRARSASIKDLLNLYIENIDFCIQSPLLTADFLTQHANSFQLQDAGIYINISGNVPAKENIVLIDCEARVMGKMYDVCRIYAKGKTRLVVDATENSSVMVDIYDNVLLRAHNHGAKLTVNMHGGTMENTGYVKINRN